MNGSLQSGGYYESNSVVLTIDKSQAPNPDEFKSAYTIDVIKDGDVFCTIKNASTNTTMYFPTTNYEAFCDKSYSDGVVTFLAWNRQGSQRTKVVVKYIMDNPSEEWNQKEARERFGIQ